MINLILLIALSDPLLTLVHTRGMSTIDPSEMPAAFEQAQEFFLETGVRFRVQYLSRGESACYEDTLGLFDSARQREIYCLANEATFNRKKTLTYYFVNNWYSGGRKFFGGLAIDICGDSAMGSADPWNGSEGHNGQIMAHEVLHLMCAKHTEPDDEPSIMSRALWRFWDHKIPVLDITKRQVRRWYAKYRRS